MINYISKGSDSVEQTIRRFYVVTGLTNTWFIAAIWLFVFREFLSDQEIGILDVVSISFGLLIEVPSGAMADRYGRKKIFVAGLTLLAIAMLGMGLMGSAIELWIFNFVFFAATAFISGADDALMYDYLKANQREHSWLKVLGRKQNVLLFVATIATAIGAGMYQVHPRLPFFAFFAFLVVSIGVASGFEESKTSKKTNVFGNVKEGFRFFLTPVNLSFAAIGFVFLGFFYSIDYGIYGLVTLNHFGFGVVALPVVWAATKLFVALAASKAETLQRRFGPSNLLMALSLVLGVAVLSLALPIGYLSAGVMTVMASAGILAKIVLNDMIQQRTSSDKRSTVLSVYALIQNLPVLLISPAIGFASTKGELPTFFLAHGVIMGVGLLISIWLLVTSLKRESAASPTPF